MKFGQVYTPNSLDVKASEMSIPNYFDPKWRNIGGRRSVRPEKIVVRNTKTKKIYGMRVVTQKNT